MADTTETPNACSRCRRTFEHLHVFESRPGVQFCADCAAELLAAGGVAKFEKTIADELREAAARLRNQGARAREATKTGHGDEWLPWETVAAHARDVTNPAAPAEPTGGAFVDHPAYRHDRTEAWYESRFLTSEVPAPVAEWMALVNPDLAEPLARWLEDTATVVTSFKVPTHPLHEPCDDPVCYTAHPALAVARVLNGGVS